MNAAIDRRGVQASRAAVRQRRPTWPHLTARITQALERAPPLGGEPCLVAYLPWTTSDPDTLVQVRCLAYDVGTPLIEPPAKTQGDGPAVYLAHLTKVTLDLTIAADERQRTILSDTYAALTELPSSSALLKCGFARLRPTLAHRKFLVAALGSECEPDAWIDWLLESLRELDVDNVVVVGRTPKGTQAALVQLTLEEMQKDLAHLVALDGEPVVVRGRDAPPRVDSLRQRILGWIEVTRSLLPKPAAPGQNAAPEGWPAEMLKRIRQAAADVQSEQADPEYKRPWHQTVIRLAYPNVALAAKVLSKGFPGADALADKLTAQESGDAAAPRHDLFNASTEDKLILRGRLRFVAALDAFYPHLIFQVRHELDGADQLYRLFLIIGGWTAKDPLLSSAVLPHWRRYLEDYVFCELVRSIFRDEDGCAVRRFESRSQLFWHVCQHCQFGSRSQSEPEQRDTTFEAVQNEFRTWVARIHDSGGKGDSLLEAGAHPGFPGKAFIGFRKRRPDNAAELLQAAQMLLAADELVGEAMHYAEIDALLTDAGNMSRGAIYTDSTLIKARALIMRGHYESALKILRILKRPDDLLVRTAVSIEEGFIAECKKDYWEAIRRYGVALDRAEDLAADELVARAMLGWLRCDALSTRIQAGSSKAQTMELRARCIVQIQAARAPNLFSLRRRHVPRVFLSYRTTTGALSEAVYKRLERGLLSGWRDKDELSAKVDADFGATIHKELLDADAIALFLSPGYFDSPWCVHELHFALGQYEVRGVPLFWTWCDRPERHSRGEHGPAPALNWEDTPLEAARAWLQRPEEKSVGPTSGEYHRFHERERVLRVIDHGECLTTKIASVEMQGAPHAGCAAAPEMVSADCSAAADESIRVLWRWIPRLYERAGLPFPKNWQPDYNARGAPNEDLQ
jgi:hypothetical protein